jgi:hypothetical protein
MASEDQLRTYVDALPPIYKEILSAFPRIEPSRRQGDGLAFQTIAADFENLHKPYSLGLIIQACMQMEQKGLVVTKNLIFVHPTAVGERLIALVAGQSAPAVSVDPLPALPT